MPYTRTTYVNNTNPPLSAANANKSETGIQTAQAAAEAAQATASGAQAAATAANVAAADAQTTAAGRLTQATADGLYVNVGEAINGGTAAAAGTALQHRSATAAQWTSTNPVLRVNELGVETDTNKLKVGTGATWTPTAYVTGSGGSGGTPVAAVTGNGSNESVVLQAYFDGRAGQEALLPPGLRIHIASAKITVRAGTTLRCAGSTLVRDGLGGSDFTVAVEADVQVMDTLRVEVEGGVNQRGVVLLGDGIITSGIEVLSVAAGAGSASNLFHGLRVEGNGTTIGRAVVTNFDYAAALYETQDVTVGSLDVSGYVCGLTVRDTINAEIGPATIKVASPNASNTAGHNGVLIFGTADLLTQRIRLPNLTVENAGEHGFRVGGSFRCRDIRLDQPVVKTVGGSGYKVLGAVGQLHEDVNLVDPVAEDCGQVNDNQAGFLMQYCKGGSLVRPVVRKRSKTFAAYQAIRVSGCEEVTTLQPYVADTASEGYVADAALGNQTGVVLRGGGSFTRCAGVPLRLDYTGATFRRVNIYDFPIVDGPTTPSLEIRNTGGTGALTGGGVVQFEQRFGTAVVAFGTTVGYQADIIAPFAGDVAFADGSTWLDRVTGVRRGRAAGVWAVGGTGGGVTSATGLSDYSTLVLTTGAQGIAGVKTFSTIPLIGATDPTVDDHATRKGYVDTQLADKSDLAHGHNLSVYNAAGTALTAAPAIQFLGDAVATYNATSQRIEVNVPTTLSGFTFKATTQTLAASSTVAQDLTSLSFAVVALANYRIYFRIKHQSSTTEHLQLTLTWPAGTTTLTAAAGGMWGYNTAGVVQRVVAHLTGATGAFRGTGTPDSIEGDIFLMVGNVAGTFQVQAAQAVSAVTQPLVQRSSFLEWARV